MALFAPLGQPTAQASGAIVIDGQFADWDGHPYVADPPGDCNNERVDQIRFGFDTNPNDETAYFMAERAAGGNQPIGLRLLLDTDNDGVYGEPTDRIVELRYQPFKDNSSVDVNLLDGSGGLVAQIVSGADWGESIDEGARRVEWGIAFSQLGIFPGQAMRMQLEASPGNVSGGSACDTSPEVQWSPANALGLPILGALAVAGAGWMAYQRRRQR